MYEYEWRIFSSGGTVEGNSKGQFESWNRTIEFYKNLYQVI